MSYYCESYDKERIGCILCKEKGVGKFKNCYKKPLDKRQKKL